MKFIQLANTDLKVSRICLGCMSFGDPHQGMHSWTLSYEESVKIIRYALDKGINFFDTAMSYQNGTSEEYLGKAIKKYAKREDVVIATKFMPRTIEDIHQGIGVKEHIERCLDVSLKRLDMDYIDLYIMHMWDENTPIEETMKALHELIEEKKIRYIGISNCYAWQIAKANEIAIAHGWQPFISVQGHYNLIFREEEREMKPYCHHHGIAMTPYSALASGRLSKHPGELSKRMKEDHYAKSKYDMTYYQDLKIIERVEQLAKEKNVSMTEISLAWLLTKVDAPIIGATKIHHIDEACQSILVQLSKEDIDYLEEMYRPHELVGMMAKHD